MTDIELKRIEKKLNKLADRRKKALEAEIDKKYKYYISLNHYDINSVALQKAIDAGEFKLTSEVFDIEKMVKAIHNDDPLDEDNIFTNSFDKKLKNYQNEIDSQEDEYESEIAEMEEDIDDAVDDFMNSLTNGEGEESKINFTEIITKFQSVLNEIKVD